MAANASPRAQRYAVFTSTLTELRGFVLEVDCLTAECPRNRMYSIGELARFYGENCTVGDILRRMRCNAFNRGCGGRVQAAWLSTGREINARVRARRVALMGPDAL